MKKDVKNMDSIEIAFDDVMRTAKRLLNKLEKIEALTDEALIKAQLSHSLIVVRKVSSEDVKKLDEILD